MNPDASMIINNFTPSSAPTGNRTPLKEIGNKTNERISSVSSSSFINRTSLTPKKSPIKEKFSPPQDIQTTDESGSSDEDNFISRCEFSPIKNNLSTPTSFSFASPSNNSSYNSNNLDFTFHHNSNNTSRHSSISAAPSPIIKPDFGYEEGSNSFSSHINSSSSPSPLLVPPTPMPNKSRSARPFMKNLPPVPTNFSPSPVRGHGKRDRVASPLKASGSVKKTGTYLKELSICDFTETKPLNLFDSPPSSRSSSSSSSLNGTSVNERMNSVSSSALNVSTNNGPFSPLRSTPSIPFSFSSPAKQSPVTSTFQPLFESNLNSFISSSPSPHLIPPTPMKMGTKPARLPNKRLPLASFNSSPNPMMNVSKDNKAAPLTSGAVLTQMSNSDMSPQPNPLSSSSSAMDLSKDNRAIPLTSGAFLTQMSKNDKSPQPNPLSSSSSAMDLSVDNKAVPLTSKAFLTQMSKNEESPQPNPLSSSSSSSISLIPLNLPPINPNAVQIMGQYYSVKMKGVGGFKNTYFFAESDAEKIITINGQNHRLGSLVLKEADFKNKNLISLRGLDPKYNLHNMKTLLEQEQVHDSLKARGIAVADIYLRSAESSTGSFVLAEKMQYQVPAEEWLIDLSITFDQLTPLAKAALTFAKAHFTLVANAIEPSVTEQGTREQLCVENSQFIDDFRLDNAMGNAGPDGTFLFKVIDPSNSYNNDNAGLETIMLLDAYLRSWSGLSYKGFNNFNKNIFNWLVSDIKPEVLVKLAVIECDATPFNLAFFKLVAEKLISSGNVLKDSFCLKYAKHLANM